MTAAFVRVVAIALALAWSLAPVYWMVATSLKTELEAANLHPTLWPHEATFDALANGFRQAVLTDALQ